MSMTMIDRIRGGVRLFGVMAFSLAAAGAGAATLTWTGAANNNLWCDANNWDSGGETIDFTAQGYSNAESVESISGTNCTITFDKGTNKHEPKYYDTGNAIRLYGGNSMTIASDSKENKIIKIELSFSSKDDGTNAITTNVGTYDDGTWTGRSSSVTFTIGGTKGHRRVQKVKITYEGGGDTPEPPGPVVSSGNYALVTDASTLSAGDKILIAYINEDDDTKLVLSTIQQNYNRAATDDVTLNADGTLTPGVDAQVITLEKDGGYYLFNVGDENADSYLYAASSTKNYMRTKDDADDNAKATISINDDGNATITFQGDFKRNTIRYNPNNDTPIFSCYENKGNSTTGYAPLIYRQVSVSKGNVNGDEKVDFEDVKMLVSWLLGQNPAGFIKEAADVDGDKNVDITDVTIIIKMLIGN